MPENEKVKELRAKITELTADWNVDDDFLFTYRQLDLAPVNPADKHKAWSPREHFYDYIELIPPDSEQEWKRAYEMICKDLLLFAGVRVQDFKDAITRSMQTFGNEKAFFAEDRRLIIDFCRLVICVY